MFDVSFITNNQFNKLDEMVIVHRMLNFTNSNCNFIPVNRYNWNMFRSFISFSLRFNYIFRRVTAVFFFMCIY